MLIDNEKTIVEINEPLDGYYFIDESTKDWKLLAQKIRDNYPYFDFVLDEEGNLVDIIPTERPEPEPPEQTEIEILKVENEKLNKQLASINSDLQGFMDFYFTTL